MLSLSIVAKPANAKGKPKFGLGNPVPEWLLYPHFYNLGIFERLRPNIGRLQPGFQFILEPGTRSATLLLQGEQHVRTKIDLISFVYGELTQSSRDLQTISTRGWNTYMSRSQGAVS